MRIGCCVNMLASADDPVGSSWLPVLRRCGYDYVELPLAQVMQLGEPEFEALLEELARSGVPCECCNNFFPNRVRLTGPDADERRVQAYLGKAVERAARLGARVIVFGSAGAKNVPPGFDRETAFFQVAGVLRRAAELCRKVGACIAIEPLNAGESNLILNLSEGASLMDAVHCGEVGLLADYYHFSLEHESHRALSSAVPRLRHVHFAEPEGRGMPRRDEEGYRRFFQTLERGGYNGRCSLEAFSQNPVEELCRGYEILSRY